MLVDFIRAYTPEILYACLLGAVLIWSGELFGVWAPLQVKLENAVKRFWVWMKTP